MSKAPALLIVLGALLAAAPARAEAVGNVGAVNQAAKGTPPGGGAHTLSLGGAVQARERIETTGVGNAQIVFRDSSTMTIGHNSSVTIDDFVFDNKAGAGRQGVSMAKGVLRFVGGGVSHGGGAQLKTPTASIGVRGAMAFVKIDPAKGTLVVLLYGAADVSNSFGAQTINTPNFAVWAPANGPVTPPFRISGAELNALMQQVASSAGQNGGASARPTNATAALGLGENRPPNDVPAPGLDMLHPFWNGLVQSEANGANQPAPPPQEHDHHYLYPGQ